MRQSYRRRRPERENIVFRKLTSTVALTLAVCFASRASLGAGEFPEVMFILDASGSMNEDANGQAKIDAANQAFPHRPVETHKAWNEMIHRWHYLGYRKL